MENIVLAVHLLTALAIIGLIMIQQVAKQKTEVDDIPLPSLEIEAPAVESEIPALESEAVEGEIPSVESAEAEVEAAAEGEIPAAAEEAVEEVKDELPAVPVE